MKNISDRVHRFLLFIPLVWLGLLVPGEKVFAQG